LIIPYLLFLSVPSIPKFTRKNSDSGNTTSIYFIEQKLSEQKKIKILFSPCISLFPQSLNLLGKIAIRGTVWYIQYITQISLNRICFVLENPKKIKIICVCLVFCRVFDMYCFKNSDIPKSLYFFVPWIPNLSKKN
jgi:hypothetical protein